jgi:lipoate-protein ligase A
MKGDLSRPSNWLLLESEACAAAENMAWDEALLEAVARLDRPVLRFYRWTEPAATFGYFQKFQEIERLTKLRPLIRRPTGGGLVPHDADWTYSLAFPPNAQWYQLNAVESYRRVHQWIQEAFKAMDVPTVLAACCRKEAPGQCFVGAERFDVLWQDRKIAGAAQRRTRDGLLIQGSIQPPRQAMRASFESAFRDAAQSGWGVQWEFITPDADLIGCVQQLVRDKYSRPEYNTRR